MHGAVHCRRKGFPCITQMHHADFNENEAQTYMRGELGAVELTLLGLGGVSVRSCMARKAQGTGKPCAPC